MGVPYVGEIRMFAGDFAPPGWMFCQGQLLVIEENDVLYQLIGTTYGGDGEVTFALPNLQSRVPVHQGQGLILGEMAGAEAVTLTTLQLPAHAHSAQARTAGTSTNPAGNVWANSAAKQFAPSGASNTPMNGGVMANTGSSQPHNNMLPFLTINFIISLYGIFAPPPT